MVIQFLLLLAFYAAVKRLLHKIRSLPPSPFPTLPVIGHLHLLKKPLHRSLSRISRRHGPVALLQFLVVSSPDAAEECLARNDVVFANRPRLLAGKHLGYNYTSLAWSSCGDHWRNLRRIASLEILSTNCLQTLSSIRLARSLPRLLAKSGGQSVDMKSAFFELMLNVMMQMIAGKRYYGENVGEVEEARKFREIVTESFRVGGANNIGEFLPFLRLMGLEGLEEKLMELQKKRDEFMQNLIDKSQSGEGNAFPKAAAAEGGKRSTTRTKLSRASWGPYNRSNTKKSREYGLVSWQALLAAGTDTSAATMEWAMSAMLNHPEIMKKARAEIDQVMGHDRLVGKSDLPKLPYLHCVMNETMRMYPVGPLLVPHESAEECRVGGYRVPGGTMLLINLFSIQNDPKYWPDAAKFKAERFEGMEGMRDGYKMMPFGSGRRGCPGEKLALRMIGLMLGSLIQCLEWERIGDEPIDMTEGTGLTMPKAQPLFAKCRARSFTSDLLSQA
ncbi:LOW QUALITY PROTEIN: hypothetical protein BT93_F0638 [Corymbia citriodora subsp. variegata]|nr:LOW QUALITY PROTEIN: hypothetical protein BT93_F0638 [Corymbia citriodora subsp. variegata]